MRYIKYKDEKELNRDVIREQVALLGEKGRRDYRINAIFSTVFFILVALVWGILLGLIIYLSKKINIRIFEILFYIASIALSTFVCGFIFFKLIKLLPQKPYMYSFQKQVRQAACAQLRQFYKFNQPFIVTKCYQSFDGSFSGHDVCLFFIQDNLVIAADIYNGFTHLKCDLGAYILQNEEISVNYEQLGEIIATRLSVNGKTMLLGRRAKSFIASNGKNQYKE